MKRILFTHSYFLHFDPKQWQIMQPYAPLGTIAAAAVTREAGYEVKLWDPMFASSVEELKSELDNFKPDALVIYDDGFNYLTKMCLTNMREAAFRMIEMSSQISIPVIVSSSDAADHYEKYLDHGATAIIKGEGEYTLREFLSAFFLNGKYSAIEGLVYRENSETKINAPRHVIKILDELPLPAWDLVNMNEYRDRWMKKHGYFSINMSTTRGCPFKCNWCAKPIYGNRYNSRSPEHVVNEIRMLIKEYQPAHIWFCDDIFGLKPGWVEQFSRLLAEEKISLRYKIQSRVDLLLQENTVAALERSGCDTVWVGAESGSQSVLDAMDKGTKVEQIYEATHLLKQHHIKPAFFLQFGYPGETAEDIRKTIDMVKTLLPDDIGISVSYPLPGTVFYERVKADLINKANWTDSDELAMMFTGNFPPAYYKHLHRYVHKSYRIHQGLDLAGKFFTGRAPLNQSTIKRMAGIVAHQPGRWYRKRKMKQFREANKNVPSYTSHHNTQKAFDSAAGNYDNQFTNTLTGSLQRSKVHQYIQNQLDPRQYQKVLELNCGTGTDAIWMSHQGFDVTGIDVSEKMVREAQTKAISMNGNKPQFKTLSFDKISELQREGTYDLIFSNFGGLNCVGPEKITSIAKQAHQLLRPGGKFIAVVMGRNCIIENVYSVLRNKQIRNRRKSTGPMEAVINDVAFPVWYYSTEEFSALLLPWLNHARFMPVGLFVPPSYLDKPFAKSKALVKSAGWLENKMNFPALADYADHFLVETTKP